jgi:CcmD family protein
MTYLVAAYAFAIVVLGGYLAWSLLRVRELQRKQ